MPVATERRLADELGIRARLEFVYKFSYQARFGDKGSENELCSVFLGRSDDPVRPNLTEVAAIRHVPSSVLARELQSSPQEFTPWFKMEWDQLSRTYAEALASYTGHKRR